ncbi:MAG: hypothetical protein ACJ8GL_07785, partial [Bacillus sp. (in: firmicutes)]
GYPIKTGNFQVGDIMQGAHVDTKNKCVYVAYEDQQGLTTPANLYLCKFSYNGDYIGRMTFQGFGHGDSILIYNEWTSNIVMQLDKDGVYKTVNFAFVDGAIFTSFSEMSTLNQFNGMNAKITCSPSYDHFAIVDGSNQTTIQVYDQNILTQATLPTPVLSIPITDVPYQGLAISDTYIFYVSGEDKRSATYNLHPQKILQYDYTGTLIKTLMFDEFASTNSIIGFREPEGAQLIKDDNGDEILLIGVSTGEYRNRINNVYEFTPKGVNPILKRLETGFHRENGMPIGVIDDVTRDVLKINKAGSYYVRNALNLPVSRAGFLDVEMDSSGRQVLLTFKSSDAKRYYRWINDGVPDEKWSNFFTASTYVNATLFNGATNSSQPVLRTYLKETPLGQYANISGSFVLATGSTADFVKVAQVDVNHTPFTTIPFPISSWATNSGGGFGYINTDGEIFVRTQGVTSAPYTIPPFDYQVG